MKYLFFTCIFCSLLFGGKLLGQDTTAGTIKLMINGKEYNAIIDDGDTLILAELNEITYVSPTAFKSRLDYARYKRYKKYAEIVYPYAVKAVRLFRETEYVTEHMDKRHRKKHIRRLQKKLKHELKDKLKDLTKLQGTILTKMIERELGKSTYELVASLRGNFIATYWQGIGMFFNYNLKRGYVEGDDYIMDIVLKEYDIDYSLKSELETNKKKQKNRFIPEVLDTIE